MTPQTRASEHTFVHVYTPEGYMQIGGMMYEAEVNKLVTTLQERVRSSRIRSAVEDAYTLGGKPAVIYVHWDPEAADSKARRGLLYVHGVVGFPRREASEILLDVYGDKIDPFTRDLYTAKATKEVLNAVRRVMEEVEVRLVELRPVGDKASRRGSYVPPLSEAPPQDGSESAPVSRRPQLWRFRPSLDRSALLLISVGILLGGIGLFLSGLASALRIFVGVR